MVNHDLISVGDRLSNKIILLKDPWICQDLDGFINYVNFINFVNYNRCSKEIVS